LFILLDGFGKRLESTVDSGLGAFAAGLYLED